MNSDLRSSLDLRRKVMGFAPPDRKHRPNFNPSGIKRTIFSDFGRQQTELLVSHELNRCPVCGLPPEHIHVDTIVEGPGLRVLLGQGYHFIECERGCCGVEADTFEAAVAEWNDVDFQGQMPSEHGGVPVGHRDWPLDERYAVTA